MDRITIFFKSKSFAILLFHVGVLLFNWPLLSLPSTAGETSVFSYLIIAWSLIVLILILVGQSIRRSEESREED